MALYVRKQGYDAHAIEGDWSIYNDGPSLKTTCPRWWGPALQHAELTPFQLTWSGPNELRVAMDAPRLEWRMSMTAPLPLRLLNALTPARVWPRETRERAEYAF